MNRPKRIEVFSILLQALSEPARFRIMALLCSAGRDLCVCEIVDALEQPQYQVSRNLKILHRAGFVAVRREGKWVHYGVASGLDRFRETALRTIASIPKGVLASDQRELNRRLKLRENGKCLLGVQKTHLLSRRE